MFCWLELASSSARYQKREKGRNTKGTKPGYSEKNKGSPEGKSETTEGKIFETGNLCFKPGV